MSPLDLCELQHEFISQFRAYFTFEPKSGNSSLLTATNKSKNIDFKNACDPLTMFDICINGRSYARLKERLDRINALSIGIKFGNTNVFYVKSDSRTLPLPTDEKKEFQNKMEKAFKILELSSVADL
ncbi:hypothetical protein JXQ70_15580 [bacterium]|nr:hypothetical protein [bacterium]